MKPYDKSNSFVRRVTKRVSELIPGTMWMNMLLGDSQSVDDDPSSTGDNDDQPPVKKLCSSNNNRTCVGVNPINSIDNHRSSHVNIHLPEISAITCIPSTSRPKSIIQSNFSLSDQDNGNSSSFKRKSDSSNIKRQYPKTITFNFASSTPALDTPNKQPHQTSSSKILNSDKSSTNNEYFTPTSSKQIKQRENESQSLLTFRETTSKQDSSPSFRWDTFVNYGELSERQKLFAQKSPLNCSRVMYGGNSARSNLSKILANSPAIHKKSVIPISPTTNSEIRTTSSILLSHISTKDKKIEENKFIIQPKVHLKYKADQKSIPLKVETTVKIANTSPEKPNDNTSKCSVRDTSRKLRANISKKVRGLKSEGLEMPAKVDLPNISLAVPVLPSIKLSMNNNEDNEFSFNQPLTIEQFSLQIAEKTCKKQQKKMLKKSPNSNVESIKKDHHLNFAVLNPSISDCTIKTSEIRNEKVSTITNDIGVENEKKDDKVSQSSQFDDDSKRSFNKSTPSFESKLDSTKPVGVVFDNVQIQDSIKNNEKSENVLVKVQKSWICDGCWVPNNSDKTNCISCQTPRPSTSEQPLKVVKSSTWTCETCWVPNKNEINSCVACQTQKPGTTKKAEENSTWNCDACWVVNKSGCTLCISCGTGKSGLVPGNKSQPSTQFKFGFNNNSSFDKSGGSQFKFGFDSGKTDKPSSQYQFGSTLKTTETGKSDTSTKEFKFGMVNNKPDEPSGTFKFGIDNSASQPVKNASEVFNSNMDQHSNLFKFGSFHEKSDQPEDQFKFGLNKTSKSVPQFKFGLDTVVTEKPVHQIFTTDANEVPQSKNESQFVINKNEIPEKSIDMQNKSSEFKFGDTKQTEKSTSQVTSGSVDTNYNSNLLIGHKNEGLSKERNFVWDKKDKIETKTVNFGTSQTIQPSIGNTNTTRLVNGHSHSNETLNEDPKQGLIKTSQLFSFGSLSKQDQNLPDDQKKSKTFTFGSAANDKKPFVTPLLSNSSFPSTVPVFGATNSIFGSVPTTSIQGTLGSSVPAPRFSFGSIAPPTSNSFFSNATKDDSKKSFSETSNSFASATNVSFSFGAPSTPVFSVASSGEGLTKSVEVDDQLKSTPNNIFNQSNTKQTVNLDPNAPISINFTGGTTTQFTANPETTEPTKRKILKPVRRIR